MVAVYLPPAWLLLIPIILVEATHGTLRFHVRFRKALVAQGVANAVSTLVGLPLCWACLASAEMLCCGAALGLETAPRRVYAVTIQAPWLIPYEQDFWWMVPSSTAVLTAVFCGMSIVIEHPVVKWAVPALDATSRWRWVIVSNVISYSLLLLAIVAFGAKISETFSGVTGSVMEGVFGVVGSMRDVN